MSDYQVVWMWQSDLWVQSRHIPESTCWWPLQSLKSVNFVFIVIKKQFRAKRKQNWLVLHLKVLKFLVVLMCTKFMMISCDSEQLEWKLNWRVGISRAGLPRQFSSSLLGVPLLFFYFTLFYLTFHRVPAEIIETIKSPTPDSHMWVARLD